MQINDYRDLEVWQLGRQLARRLYQLTAKFPDEEKFGLISQLGRAGVSIQSKVAEGWSRRYTAEFIQGLRRAKGSRTEVETQMVLSADFGYATPQEVEALLKETELLGKKLLNLERSVERRQQK